MRALPLAVSAFAIVSMCASAQAQSTGGLYIEAKPRSWLDAGKVVEPHSMQNYMFDTAQANNFGARSSNHGLLPDRFSSGSPIKIDIPAPDFLRR
ncbi:hypothetical protein MCEMSEM23_01564 [Rhabdaerophilaceae bacterium]